MLLDRQLNIQSTGVLRHSSEGQGQSDCDQASRKQTAYTNQIIRKVGVYDI